MSTVYSSSNFPDTDHIPGLDLFTTLPSWPWASPKPNHFLKVSSFFLCQPDTDLVLCSLVFYSFIDINIFSRKKKGIKVVDNNSFPNDNVNIQQPDVETEIFQHPS